MPNPTSYLALALALAPLAASLGQGAPQDFVRLKDTSPDFVYDMRYATANNFLKKPVYDCPDCVVRRAVAEALAKANAHFMAKGYRICLYDCYRPLAVQEAMWAIYPKPGYVANPKTGSIHNRGGAVDVTLVDQQGKPLDMGTEFDHFGIEAHHSHTEGLSEQVLANRKLLREGMEAYGFFPIRTEWWHYNYGPAKQYPLGNFKVKCED